MKLITQQRSSTNHVCCCRQHQSAGGNKFVICITLLLLVWLQAAAATPLSISRRIEEAAKVLRNSKRRAWPPPLKQHNIWSETAADNDLSAGVVAPLPLHDRDDFDYVQVGFDGTSAEEAFQGHMLRNVSNEKSALRQSKVLHIFPLPVDGECLSDDGRRTGTCFNAYECRQKGGQAKGDCAMGFGVCCIFVADCNVTVSNNITYLISPNFPSFMAQNFTSCSIKVKTINDDISQLRFDFYHFSLGQPNRRTGVCDGDAFSVSGGLGGVFTLCGQNSGQHMYYEVGGRALPRQAIYANLRPLTLDQVYPNRNSTIATGEQTIEIVMNFAQRFLPIRLWEIRIAQIPFSQRAPAGCLQYFTGTEGIVQTFNFAENGRHLANQNYRICMRQETEMCSIMYQPCDEQSFRIGPSDGSTLPPQMASASMMGMGMPAVPAAGLADATGGVSTPTTTSISMSQGTRLTTTPQGITNMTAPETTVTTEASSTTANTTTTISTTATATTTTTAATTSAAAESSSESTDTTAATTSTTTTTTQAPLSDDVDEQEGSGGEDEDYDISPPPRPSRRPRPVSGGFDLLGLIRNAFDFGFRRRRHSRQWPPPARPAAEARQFYTTCNDRITMPCIVEDFISLGMDALPGCEPVHCGAQFCASGVWPCRIESTVTPFYIGVRFGNGVGKGSAEDNIGACLRYSQVQCM